MYMSWKHVYFLYTIMQVIALDEECTPQRLIALGSTTTFVVVCERYASQLASIDTNNLRISLRRLLWYDIANKYNKAKTVFITRSDSLLRIVTYISDNMVQLYAVSELSPEVLQLPENINCTSEPSLHPLNTREVYLVHCMTESGPKSYVVPAHVPPGKAAQTISTAGIPYSSQDGAYILVVNGAQVTIYSIADTHVPLSQKRLPSEIKSVANLDNENVRLLTENREHVVMNIKNSLAEPRYMPGAPPILSEWVDSSNHYIYLTENGALYVMNETSIYPQYELQGIVNLPKMILFFEVKPTESPSGPSDGIAVGNIIMMFVTFFIIMIVLLVLCSCGKSKKKKSTQQTDQNPTQQTSQQPTQQNSQKPTQQNSQKPTQQNSQKPTQQTSQKSTQQTSQQPTQQTSQKPTQQNSQKPTQQANQHPLQENKAKNTTETPPKHMVLNHSQSPEESDCDSHQGEDKHDIQISLSETDGIPLLEAQALQ